MTTRILKAFGIRLISLAVLFAIPLTAMSDQYWTYTVRPGDTIWSLTEKHCTSVLHWKMIQRINNLPDEPARGILPGTRINFPIDILKHQPASATIHLVQGTAKLIRGESEPATVTPDTELISGDRLIVDENSNLTIRFADGSKLLVLGGSEISMDSLSAYGETGMVDTRIRLKKGQVDTHVKPSKGAGSRYEIITPAAVAAVRGTDFRVASDLDLQVSRSEVLEGTVDVAGQGASQRVASGFGVIARQNQPPEKPKPLLPQPDLSPQPETLDRLPLQFRWNPVEGARNYRFQIADNSEFSSLLADATSTSITGYWPDLPDGNYQLRVRAIDDEGLEGLNAIREFTVAAHPEPPVPIGPSGKVIVRDATPEFSWSRPEEIDSYHFQLASEQSFANLAHEETIHSTQNFEPDSELSPGSYHWRIASIDKQGKQGPASDPMIFEYRPVPETPEPEAPKLDQNEISFNWRSAGENMQYQFQMAPDAGFTSISVNETVAEPRITIPTPTPENYYFRIRSIDETGYAGPWSTTQSFSVSGSPWYLFLPLVLLLLV